MIASENDAHTVYYVYNIDHTIHYGIYTILYTYTMHDIHNIRHIVYSIYYMRIYAFYICVLITDH